MVPFTLCLQIVVKVWDSSLMDSVVAKAIPIRVSLFCTTPKLSLLSIKDYDRDETLYGCNSMGLVFIDAFWFWV